MGGFITFISILGVLILGMVTLIFRLSSIAEAKELRKDPLRPPVEVRFRPKAFLVLAAGIVAAGLFIVLAVVLGRDRGVPSYVFVVGLAVLVGIFRPLLAGKVGKPFGVATVGAEADVLPVATGPAPIYPGQHTAPLMTADGRPFLPPNAGGAPQPGQYAPGQYQPGQPGQDAPGYYTPEGHAPDVDGGEPRHF